jgi:hypothetical protein
MLRELADGYACAVLIINQTRSAHRQLAAFVDIVIEMQMPPNHARRTVSGGEPTRRRIITGVGRYQGTLESVTAERNAEGTDYVQLGDDVPPPSTLLMALQSLLAAGRPM